MGVVRKTDVDSEIMPEFLLRHIISLGVEQLPYCWTLQHEGQEITLSLKWKAEQQPRSGLVEDAKCTDAEQKQRVDKEAHKRKPKSPSTKRRDNRRIEQFMKQKRAMQAAADIDIIESPEEVQEASKCG